MTLVYGYGDIIGITEATGVRCITEGQLRQIIEANTPHAGPG